MIKFILHGGKIDISEKLDEEFFGEIFKNIVGKEKIIVLITCFARNKDEWQSVFTKNKLRFSKFISKAGIESVEFVLADSDQNKFLTQVDNSDVVYFCGGSELEIRKIISEQDLLIDIFRNKVIVGTSAGANIFSAEYYSNDRNRIEPGFGFIPIKTICHFSLENKERLDMLLNYNGEKPTFAIEESHFVVFYL